MTKNMIVLAMVVMLFAQMGIAQHSVGHFTDHGHYEHSDHDHDRENDHKKSASETCQICLLTQSLSFGLLAYHINMRAPVLAGHDIFKSHDYVLSHFVTALYNPRAPPVHLT